MTKKNFLCQKGTEIGNLAAKIRETRQTECENKKGDNAEKSVVECVEPPDQVETISEPTEVERTEPETTDKENHVPERTIVAAPTIQEPDPREQELDELIAKLRQVNRHWKIEWVRKKDVPMKALLHAAALWLSDDPDDWTAANDTIFAFTSHFGKYPSMITSRFYRKHLPNETLVLLAKMVEHFFSPLLRKHQAGYFYLDILAS